MYDTIGRHFAITLLFAAMLIGLSSCGGHSVPDGRSPAPHGLAVVQTARSVLGVPYAWGGETPQTGFDCSGLTYWAFSQNGIYLPRTTSDQISTGRKVGNDFMPGDLVFFQIGQGNHVGIYAGQGIFIHSPKSGSVVREENMFKDYWMSRFVGARRHF